MDIKDLLNYQRNMNCTGRISVDVYIQRRRLFAEKMGKIKVLNTLIKCGNIKVDFVEKYNH